MEKQKRCLISGAKIRNKSLEDQQASSPPSSCLSCDEEALCTTHCEVHCLHSEVAFNVGDTNTWTSRAGAQQDINEQNKGRTNQNEASHWSWPWLRLRRGRRWRCCWWQIKTVTIPSVSKCTWRYKKLLLMCVRKHCCVICVKSPSL